MIYNQGEKLIKEIKNTKTYTSEVAIWSLGQSGFIIKSNDNFICIDPYLTYSIEENDPDTEFKRVIPPPLAPKLLKGVDGVLVTHFHDDHMNLETLKQISDNSEKTLFVSPASHSSFMSNVGIRYIKQVSNDSKFLIKDFSITPVEVAHTRYERDANGNPFYFGYFIEVNGVKMFHSGDTVATKEIINQVSELQPDIVFVPINGEDYARTARGIVGNMNYREAADFGVSVGADLIIPNHYDMFPNNSENPAYFVDYIFHNYPSQKFHMMVAGERFIYRNNE